MLGELETVRVEGLDFNSIQVDIVRLVRHYINENFDLYRERLNSIRVEKEDIEMDVYQRLYNRRENQLSNIERYFIDASEKGMKYIICIIKKVVYISVLQFFRSKYQGSLSNIYSYTDLGLSCTEGLDESKNLELIDAKAEVNIYENLEYQDLLSKIPNRYFKGYKCIHNNYKGKLTVRVLLDLIVCGYDDKELRELIFTTKGDRVRYKVIIELKEKAIKIAKKSLKEYKGIDI